MSSPRMPAQCAHRHNAGSRRQCALQRSRQQYQLVFSVLRHNTTRRQNHLLLETRLCQDPHPRLFADITKPKPSTTTQVCPVCCCWSKTANQRRNHWANHTVVSHSRNTRMNAMPAAAVIRSNSPGGSQPQEVLGCGVQSPPFSPQHACTHTHTHISQKMTKTTVLTTQDYNTLNDVFWLLFFAGPLFSCHLLIQCGLNITL